MASHDTPDGGPISFKRLMVLRPIGTDSFASLTPAWPPGGRAFGGHIYAQAAYAASKTVAKGMLIHNVTGHFILPGRVDVPFTYHIRRIRDGGVYCLRSVDVYQDAQNSSDTSNTSSTRIPCFVATVSFKREESSSRISIPFQHQNDPDDHLQSTYQSVLAGKEILAHRLSPGVDAIWCTEQERVEWTQAAKIFPGLEIRKVDMSGYNGSTNHQDYSKAGEWRQLCFYRLITETEDETGPVEVNAVVTEQEEDAESDDVNLDACAHLYASDRNSLFLVQRALGFDDRVAMMASLSHTVVFHGSPQHLRLKGNDGRLKWFVQEAWSSNSGENRGCHESRLWDWGDGRIIATTVQDGMVRIPYKHPKL